MPFLKRACPNGVDRPNFTPGHLQSHTDPRGGKPAFNTALFNLPFLGQLGTASRRFFYCPGIDNFNLAILKSLRLKESVALQFRMEAFNAFNPKQFYGPATVKREQQQPGVRTSG
jgi:hypothetical protein